MSLRLTLQDEHAGGVDQGPPDPLHATHCKMKPWVPWQRVPPQRGPHTGRGARAHGPTNKSDHVCARRRVGEAAGPDGVVGDRTRIFKAVSAKLPGAALSRRRREMLCRRCGGLLSPTDVPPQAAPPPLPSPTNRPAGLRQDSLPVQHPHPHPGDHVVRMTCQNPLTFLDRLDIAPIRHQEKQQIIPEFQVARVAIN